MAAKLQKLALGQIEEMALKLQAIKAPAALRAVVLEEMGRMALEVAADYRRQADAE